MEEGGEYGAVDKRMSSGLMLHREVKGLKTSVYCERCAK